MHEGDEHDATHAELHRGLAHDLELMGQQMAEKARSRRLVLGLLAGGGVLLGCAGRNLDAVDSASGLSATSTTGGASTNADGTCSTVPEETAGPYPGDGSNGPNVLNMNGIVRSDIRTSLGALSGTAAGVELTVTLTLVSAASCDKLAGYAVYLWHCDRDGNYSLYSEPNQNYLRGVQETDESGQVTFTTIFPACYAGRWPHIHYEIYPSLKAAADVGNKLATSQLAMPKAQCDEVFASAGYERSVRNLTQVSVATDNVFRDGATLETPAMRGSVSSGYAATLTVAV